MRNEQFNYFITPFPFKQLTSTIPYLRFVVFIIVDHRLVIRVHPKQFQLSLLQFGLQIKRHCTDLLQPVVFVVLLVAIPRTIVVVVGVHVA